MTRVAVLLGVVFGAASCTVPNVDHCLHRKPNGHAWCIDQDRTRTYCSPCADAHDGCVSQPPTESQCPEYEPPMSDGDTTDGGSSSASGSSESGATGDSTAAVDPGDDARR